MGLNGQFLEQEIESFTELHGKFPLRPSLWPCGLCLLETSPYLREDYRKTWVLLTVENI